MRDFPRVPPSRPFVAMNGTSFDVLVLGTGPAGQTVATRAAAAGLSVGVVETRQPGGTCALRGCNPKKVLAEAADLHDRWRGLAGKSFASEPLPIDWPTLSSHMRSFTEPVPASTRDKFESRGIALFESDGGPPPSFVDAEHVRFGDQVLAGTRVAICTGARPRDLTFEGGSFATTSDEFLAMEDLPSRVAFIGGGYISMEFANAVVRSGRRVTVVDSGDRVLDDFDPDLVGLLMNHLRGVGLDLRLHRSVDRVRAVGEGFELDLVDDHDQPTETIAADLVVHGAGRQANLDGMNLPAAGLERTKTGLVVDETMRCSGQRNVFAAGDCCDTGLPPLTPTAEAEADVVSRNLIEDADHRLDPGPIPMVAYTSPRMGAVGMSHDRATEQVDDLRVYLADTSTKGPHRKAGQPVAGHKVLADGDGRIVGGHVIGPGAEEQINLLAMAMRHEIAVDQIPKTVLAYPTFGADLRGWFDD